jgi:hypothetical protein
MKMKSRVAVLMIALMSVALLFGCATSGKDEGKLDPNLVRSDNLKLWDEAGWTDLTPAEQALWKDLGWDEASWEGEAKKPPSEDMYWKQLTDKERMAAEKLGYTKETWDE